MTDGTSQGLFIVVAIVIFGIFVALSYTVFGNDGMTGSTVNMFETALTEVENKTNPMEKLEGFDMSRVVDWRGSDWIVDLDNEKMTFSSDSSYIGGVYLPEELFDMGETYTLKFAIRKLDGEVQGLGGHLATSTNVLARINNRRVPLWEGNESTHDRHDWSRTLVYPNDNELHNVSVTFTVDRDSSDRNVYIQPNRNPAGYTQQLSYRVELSDIELYIHK